MILSQITYLDVSAERSISGKTGHVVKVAYTADIPSSFPEYFDVVEEIIFRMDWKGFLEGREYQIATREKSIYPIERINLVGRTSIVRSREVFILKDFLKWEGGFPDLAELSCRISLTPVLTTVRKSLDITRLDREGRYRLTPKTEGYPPVEPITPAYPY